MSNHTKAIGVDIGGSFIKAAIVDTSSGKLENDPLKIPLPNVSTPENVLKEITTVLDKWTWSGLLGVGFPGVVVDGKVMTAHHLDQKWLGYDFLKCLRKLNLVNVALLNDADAAGLAEMEFGSGRDWNRKGGGTVVLVTLGTGIGTALFRDSILVPNTEFGHLEIEGRDAELSASALVRMEQSLTWEEWGRQVNKYLLVLERLLFPDLIIIGGGVSENFNHFEPYLETRAQLVPATLKNNAGLIGTALSVERLNDFY